jgi:DNA primase
MEIVDQVRQAASIVEIASQYTTLRQRGRKHVGLCPFHAEKTPSFTVDLEKGLFHCFGCGIGGDVFSLVMEKENLSFPEALKALADRYHIAIPDQRKLSPQALKLEEQVLKLNESAMAFFHRNLTGTPEGVGAREYLLKRGVTDSNIRDWKIGYALNSWDSLTLHFKGKGISPSLLEKAGLAVPGKRPGEVYDRFRGRAIFPIFGLTGKVLGFGGRTLINAEPKYLNSPDTPVYTKGQVLYGLNITKESIRSVGEAVLVEGYTDFLALLNAGVPNVVASLGTALTAPQVGLIHRFAPRITLNYDGDAAGRTAMTRAVPICFEKGLETRVVVLPEGLDPDAFIRKHGPEEYRKRLESAGPALKFIIGQATAGKRMTVPEVKARIMREILAIVESSPDSIVRSEHLKQAAEALGTDEQEFRALSVPSGRGDKPAAAPDLFLPAEKRLLQILIGAEELRSDIFAEVREGDLKGLKCEPVFAIILDWFKNGKDLIIHELQKEIGPTLSPLLSLAMLEKEQPPTLEEALDCLRALRRTSIEAEVRRIQADIGRLERSGDAKGVEALLFRKQDLTRELMSLG